MEAIRVLIGLWSESGNMADPGRPVEIGNGVEGVREGFRLVCADRWMLLACSD